MKKISIAIDGHSSCGKSTMAKRLARRIGYVYVDTGAMYRAVTLLALRLNLFAGDALDEERLKQALESATVGFRINAETGLPETLLSGEPVESEIRGMAVSERVSQVAALPFVRAAMTRQQQLMGAEGGIVMDGRDIGTAVLPKAELKVFLTASPDVRAQRRFDELRAKGDSTVSLEEIKKNLLERDYIDSHRDVAPLRQADDALLLDNSRMTLDEQDEWLYARYKEVAEA